VPLGPSLVMLIEVALFTAFVLAGVLLRKRPKVHKAMMLLASLSILAGATVRMPDQPPSSRISPLWALCRLAMALMPTVAAHVWLRLVRDHVVPTELGLQRGALLDRETAQGREGERTPSTTRLPPHVPLIGGADHGPLRPECAECSGRR
jgi:hypothetical protein